MLCWPAAGAGVGAELMLSFLPLLRLVLVLVVAGMVMILVQGLCWHLCL